jgi:uncharacterized membrane protein HdeD (DUF308 family)
MLPREKHGHGADTQLRHSLPRESGRFEVEEICVEQSCFVERSALADAILLAAEDVIVGFGCPSWLRVLAGSLHCLFLGGRWARQNWRSDMSSTAQVSGPLGSTSGLAPLRAKSGWIVALGIVYVIAGLIALGSVVLATVATVFVVGVMMLIAGVAEVINAFQIKTWGKFLLWLLLGVLYILAGFVTFENPLLAAALLTLFLGCSLVASGAMRVILGFAMKGDMPWIGVVLSGVITFLLGLIILIHWPVSSLYILGIFLGIDLVFAGASWIAIGLGLRRLA